MAGAGDHLKDLVKEFTGDDPKLGCSCKQWIDKMNASIEWCKAHKSEIVGHLMNEARTKGRKWRITPIKGAFRVSIPFPSALLLAPGSTMMLSPFIGHMVSRAISMAEADLVGSGQ